MPFFGYSFCFSCKYSSRIPSNCFVALFVLMLSFSDSKVEISSVFNDANRLKAICLHFKSTQCWRDFQQAADRAGGLGSTACDNTLFWTEVRPY